jgi:tRNA A37 threonylcarbamoyladenosine dehydratase
MLDQFARTQLLYGADAMARLAQSRVLVIGIGGVGGYAVEALARSGVGTLGLVDDDTVCLTNLNRQILATHRSIGRRKVDVARERVLDINPRAAVQAHACIYLPNTADSIDFAAYDYIVDASDTVKGKLTIVTRAKELCVPVISAMGAGNKIDPTRFRVCDIYQTKNDPLARVMRGELRKRGIDSLKVVSSDEPPIRPVADDALSCKTGCVCPPGAQRTCAQRRAIPASNAFVPAVAGLVLAGAVIADLTGFNPGARRTGA